MTIRTTMTALIARVRRELNDDTTFSDQALQDMLDARGTTVQTLLLPRAPAYTTHASGTAWLEDGALLYPIPGIIFPGWQDWTLPMRDRYASDILVWWLQTAYQIITPLTSPTEYTIDSMTGVVTTPAADRRGLLLVGRSYLVYAACADAWGLLAARLVTTTGEIKQVTSDGDTVQFSSPQAQALTMAAYYRSLGSGGGLAL